MGMGGDNGILKCSDISLVFVYVCVLTFFEFLNTQQNPGVSAFKEKAPLQLFASPHRRLLGIPVIRIRPQIMKVKPFRFVPKVNINND